MNAKIFPIFKDSFADTEQNINKIFDFIEAARNFC